MYCRKKLEQLKDGLKKPCYEFRGLCNDKI